MRKIVLVLAFAGILYSQQSNAQSVSISKAKIINVSNTNIVYVSGILTGAKGIPITGYTIDVISSDKQTTRVVTNAPSSGGNFTYTNTAVIKGNEPYAIKVTTNRQTNSTANATSCNCK